MTSMIVRGPGRPSRYKLADGEPTVSVTTINGQRKYKPEGLMIWYYNNGYEDGWERRENDPRRKLREAGDTGTLCHGLIENHIHGKDLWEGLARLSEPQNAQALLGLASFQDWSRVMQVTYLETETPMVSEKYRYGGTPDAIATVDGKRALLDWKTSNKVYGDYVIQLAAYRQLWNEVHPDDPIQACYLLRVGKDEGDFHVHAYPPGVIAMAWEAFVYLRALYDLDAKLGKVAS